MSSRATIAFGQHILCLERHENCALSKRKALLQRGDGGSPKRELIKRQRSRVVKKAGCSAKSGLLRPLVHRGEIDRTMDVRRYSRLRP